MARGKQTCQSTGVHQMNEFSVTRKKKKKNVTVTTVTSGVRCKWCKTPEGRLQKKVTHA